MAGGMECSSRDHAGEQSGTRRARGYRADRESTIETRAPTGKATGTNRTARRSFAESSIHPTSSRLKTKPVPLVPFAVPVCARVQFVHWSSARNALFPPGRWRALFALELRVLPKKCRGVADHLDHVRAHRT